MENERVVMIEISKIKEDKYINSRNINENALRELADSIKEHGIIEPLVVAKDGENYIIVSGMRRLAAAKLAGISEVPAIITK